jgi:hypothetical protein
MYERMVAKEDEEVERLARVLRFAAAEQCASRL